jgi:hypothetical protein
MRFCEQYNVSADWIICGDAATIRDHLAKHAQGIVAILPAKGSWYRRLQRIAKERGMPEPT